MSDRRNAFGSGQKLLKALAFDVFLLVLWRAWGNSWASTFRYGGFLISVTLLVSAYIWWKRRDPKVAAEIDATQDVIAARTAERLAAQAAAAEAANRSSGRQPGTRY
ncbi:hypothetical protein [Streptomyces sp. NPDC020917]|uniref:hypothetical protein n=1 Tax=Streptomyces sp. NPDC020917 TaxID=3365102 RepID=UPI003787E82D